MRIAFTGAPGGALVCERSQIVRVLKACLGVALALSLALAASGCGGGCPVHRLLFGSKKAEVAQAPGPQTQCPIMGGKIDRKLFVDYEGKRIYVCCSDCVPKVKQDPAKYVKQLEDAGVVLEKAPAAKP